MCRPLSVRCGQIVDVKGLTAPSSFGVCIWVKFPLWICHCLYGACRGVTRLDGARGQKQVWCPPLFEPEVFQKQMYCIEQSTCDIVGTFLVPTAQWFGAPILIHARGIVTPFLPSLRPRCMETESKYIYYLYKRRRLLLLSWIMGRWTHTAKQNEHDFYQFFRLTSCYGVEDVPGSNCG